MYPPAKRQRTARACDECKRKKKQCSGSQPCSLCATRNRTCIFSDTSAACLQGREPGDTPRRRESTSSAKRPEAPWPDGMDVPSLLNPNELARDTARETDTAIHNEGRLLQDGEGRLIYVGDSASLSFLQTIRRLVEGTIGRSTFTEDHYRHRILEGSISTPPRYQHTHVLPDQEAAIYLTDSFFARTTGLFHIFNRAAFKKKLLETYTNPLVAEPHWLCQVNLVFAVGLQLNRSNAPTTSSTSSSAPSNLISAEMKILDRLGVGGVNRSEIFFLNAKHLNDPICGFEDGGFSSIQSLLLMTIYMLTASKRNTAWAYLGMATRLAYALGIHKEETYPIFSPAEQDLRRNLWRSLYIMDCFLSSSLGRPNSISTCAAAEVSPLTPSSTKPSPSKHRSSFSSSVDETVILNATFDASLISGQILHRFYTKRKASRQVALEIAQQFNDWKRSLPASLHWENLSNDTSSGDPDALLRRLHVNLIYFHGVILLTRPFLLYEISMQLKRTPSRASVLDMPNTSQATTQNCFHGACVQSAVHVISIIHSVFSAAALPRKDPFVIYFLFTSALIVLANTFCPVYRLAEASADFNQAKAIQHALEVFRPAAEVDSQARRYLTILEAFDQQLQADQLARQQQTGAASVEGQNIFNVLFGREGEQGVDVNGVGSSGGLPVDPNAAAAAGAVGGVGIASSVPWSMPATVGGMGEDMIDFDSIWWPMEGQDGFADVTGGMGNMERVPLYGLMKSFD